ncbi:MAG: arylsulfatase [Caulobacter sp.]|nr:arylsulfatase [Caulobacter sp.]
MRARPARTLRSLFSLSMAILIAAAPVAAVRAQASAPKRPNIVMIVVDDAALMDFGAFGGEARTPNIDRLAKGGAMFTAYHSSPLCSPSRAMLLTGVDNHRAGVATIEEILPPSQKDKPGYGLQFAPGIWTVARRLKAEGYRTLMVGKWHLGHGPGALPNENGFDRSLALDASGADNWGPKPYMPYYDSAPWFEDGKPVKMPDRYYSSDIMVDRLKGYIDERPAGAQPFYAYLAFQAVHIPVQAPKEYSDRYKGRFDAGWEKLREDRAARARALGLMPADAAIRGLPDDARRWDQLTAEEKAIYARSMEVYSGMLEAMDAAIGRLMTHLEARGELDNTLFVVTSDNGPEPSDPVHVPGMGLWMKLNGYRWTLKGLGEKGSLAYIGKEWASALSAPGSRYKFYTSQGGIRVPLILSGPGVAAGTRVSSPAFVTDVVPTLVDLVGARAQPDAVSMDGRSLRPVLTGAATATWGPDEPVGIEVSGNAALFRGDHKIVRDMPPVGDGQWRLYDLARDPGETTDLAAAQPALFKQMLADYAAYEVRVGVQPLPEGYTTQNQLMNNAMGKQRPRIIVMALLLLGVVGGLIAGAVLLLRRRGAKAA